ncbi:hypothetical protein FZW96_05965 [Bacillus sp. BGMRC 2118]|nr:hypothetical protein FZW96_05965 [Bacillus sp. BGMRC 2118]
MRTQQIVLIVIAFLAVIGLVNTDPWSLLQMIGFIVLISVVFYFVFRFVQKRRNGSWQDYSRYRKAAIQSKKRYKPNKGAGLVKKSASPTLKRRSTVQLTVIEGKKNQKKKNRALH